MVSFKRVGQWFAPDADKDVDGRAQWGSRLSFILASLGGAVGLGNLLRYPGQVFNNNGAQWFIPYLLALFFLGIPILMLEISIGQGYKGGCIIAFDHIHKRFKGVGLAVIFTGYSVVVYYVVILAYVMRYFRSSFSTPFPWEGRPDEFYAEDVHRAPDPVEGTFDGNGNVETYYQWPATGIVGETVGWTAFTWFVVWLCMFKGIGLTGRVVYFTMGLPLIMIIILLGRGLSLPNAGRGVALYFGSWDSSKLANREIWQAASGQIFFSIGVGFGYFTSYASYNNKFSNAVQDALIIAFSNSLIEVIAAFAVFGVIGFLGLQPSEETLSTFTIAFLTYPEALAQMPGAAFFSVIFFATLMLLGISSSFALMEAVVTLVTDSDWGKKFPRWMVATGCVTVSFLLSIMFCTEFGYYLLDAVDTYVNNLALFFVTFMECASATTVYRYKDVMGQCGKIPYFLFNAGYFLALILGVGIGHAVHPGAGAGVGFGIFIITTVTAVLLSKRPDALPPRFWGNNAMLSKLWYLAFYSGQQLTRDLNLTVAQGKNWPLPWIWTPMLKYITCPILAIVFSLAYPTFHANRANQLHIFAFTIMHLTMVIMAIGFIVPRWFDVFVPSIRRGEGELHYAPGVTMVQNETEENYGIEGGEGRNSSPEGIIAEPKKG